MADERRDMQLKIESGTKVLTYEEIPYGALFQEDYQPGYEDAMIRMKVKAGHPYFQVQDDQNPREPGHDICISVWRRLQGAWGPEFKWFLPPVDEQDWDPPLPDRRFRLVCYTMIAEKE